MKKLRTTFGSREPKDLSPSLFYTHNLNHVSVFSSYLCLSCWPSSSPALAHTSPLPYRTRIVGLSTYVITSFLNLFSFLFTLPPIVFVFFTSPFFFHSPLTLCLSLFTFSTLELFPTCFSQLPFSACLFSVLPLLFCGRTGELD
jgi:hypothetical protein